LNNSEVFRFYFYNFLVFAVSDFFFIKNSFIEKEFLSCENYMKKIEILKNVSYRVFTRPEIFLSKIFFEGAENVSTFFDRKNFRMSMEAFTKYVCNFLRFLTPSSFVSQTRINPYIFTRVRNKSLTPCKSVRILWTLPRTTKEKEEVEKFPAIFFR
jgi:hypothetical protein